MTIDELRAALSDPNLQAFLRVIRAGETSQDDSAYRMMFGGSLFDSFADHPRRAITIGRLTSTAAGAFQFLSRTWDGLVNQYGFADFSPASQDLGAVALIAGRKALTDVLAGRIEAAIGKCNREWASLPGSPYGQPTRTLAEALATYREFGGVLRPSKQPAPIETRTPTPVPSASIAPPPVFMPAGEGSPQEKPMLPFVAAAIPALIEAAPSLIRIFGNSPQAEKNAQAAEAVAEIAKKATGSPTVEGAVAAIQQDPEQAAAYREAVHQSMGDLLALMLRAGEADDKSRAAAMDRNVALGAATGGKWLWLLGIVALIVVGMSYWITWGVLFDKGASFGNDTKALLLGQIVILGFATVLAFLFGSNIQSRMRDEAQKSDKR